MSFAISTLNGCALGCCNGVAMDVDVFHEGYAHDTIYPPCPCNPKFCKTCSGTGWAPEDTPADSDDCPDCDGCGWTGGQPEHPDDRYALLNQEAMKEKTDAGR